MTQELRNIQLKRGTASDLYAVNPLPLRGEPILEIDTGKIKYGDGTTHWRDLPYGNPSLEVVDAGEFFRDGIGTDPNAFIPPNLSGLALWLDATYPNYISVVNSKVSQLDDKSLYTHHFFQSLKANRPVVYNQINDLDVLTFDGSNDAMLSSFDLSAQCTVFIVLKRRGIHAGGEVFSATRNDGSNFSFCSTEDGVSFGVLSGGQMISTQNIEDLSPCLYGLTIGESSLTTRINGLVPETSDYTNASSFKKFSIGSSRSDYSASAYGGDVAEIVVYNRVLSDSERQQVETYLLGRWGIIQVVHPLLNGMVAFWPMNEESGDRLDISGNNKTLAETGTVTSVAGVLSQSSNFTTGSNYLSTSSLTLTPSFTVSMWFKPEAVTGGMTEMIQNWYQASEGQFLLLFGDDTGETSCVACEIITSDGFFRTSFVGITAGEWKHVVVSYSAADGVLSLYLDNILADQTNVTGTINTTSIPIRMGIGEQTSRTNDLNFSADSVGIWNRALSTDEIDMLWNGGFGKEDFTADLYGDNVSLLLHMNKLPNSGSSASLDIPNPLAYWKFSEAEGSFLDSRSGLEITETNGTISRSEGVVHISDGDQAWLTLPAGVCDIGSSQKTFSVWFKLPQAINNYQWLLMQNTGHDYDECNPFYFESTGYLNCVFTTQSYTWTNYPSYTNSPPSAGEWHHAVAVFNGSTCTLYYDGEQVNQSNYYGAITSSKGSYTLGQYSSFNPSYLANNTSSTNIYIAKLGIWDTALTYENVTTLFNAGFDTQYTPPPKPTASMPPVSTSLLLHFDGPNGSTSFKDSGDYSLSVTANGSAVISTAQSKFGGASLYVDGYSYISVSENNGEFTFGTNDFTIELWMKDSGTSPEAAIITTADPTDNQGIWLGVGNTGSLYWLAGDGSWAFSDTTTSSSVLDGQWHHLAYVRSGGTLLLFLDGTQVATQEIGSSYSLTNSNGLILVGGRPLYDQYFTGYIDELRIVKGQALYTVDFTPPAAPFAGKPEPSLLLNFDGSDGSTSFTDSSPNALTVTANGDAAISTAQSKFGGASAHFSGPGEPGAFLTVENNDAIAFGTGDFTIEFWLYFEDAEASTAGAYFVFTRGTNALYFVSNENQNGFLYAGNAAGEICSSAAAAPHSQWVHVALVRSAGYMRIYLNGVGGAAVANSDDFTQQSTSLFAHPDYSQYGNALRGYIDNFRIVKGKAIYTGNFTPPDENFVVPQPVPDLLLHFDSTSFTDSGKNQLTVTANGNAAISTEQSKFGGASGYFDGSSYVSISDQNAFTFGKDDLTIEIWIKYTGGSGEQAIITTADPTDQEGFWLGVSVDETLYWLVASGGSWLFFEQTSANIADGGWHHIAIVRIGSFVKLFMDGNEVSTQQIGSSILTNINSTLKVGGRPLFSQYFSGYIDELRIIKGTALYTDNFTPPAAPFLDPIITTTGGSSLTNGLVAFWRMDDLTDSSGNNYTLDNYGATFSSGKIGNAATLDGSTYLRAPVPQPTTAVTLAAWVYLNYIDGGQGAIVIDSVTGNNWGGGGCGLDITPDGHVIMYAFYGDYVTNGGSPEGAGDNTYSSATLSTGQWYHLAGTYDSATSTGRVYINGSLDQENTFASRGGPFGGSGVNTFGIGTNGDGTWGIVNGQIDAVGIWDRVLTPEEIGSLYNNGDGTETLTGGSVQPVTYFYDHSKNHYEVTAVGDAQISTTEVKFGNGSGKFDGEGDHLELSSTPGDLGSGDFTIEFWCKPTAFADYTTFAGNLLNNSTGSPEWQIICNGTPGEVSWYYPAQFVSISGELTVGTWQHVAFVRSSGTLSLYIDGMSTGSAQHAYDYSDPPSPLWIGHTPENLSGRDFSGYLDDFRITKGVARYTSNFTPPTKEFPDPVITTNVTPSDPYAEDVVLLLHCDGADGGMIFTDNSYIQNAISTNGNAQISTTQSKFGGSSAYFDGDGDYLSVAYNDSFDLGSDDFTIEGWIWLSTGSNSTDREFVSGGGGFPNGWAAYVSGNGGSCGLSFAADNGSGWNGDIIQSAQISENSWHHVAFVRSSGVIFGYVDGTQVGSSNIFSGSLNANNSEIKIGNSFSGYIDDFRITKGVARYTSNFTPPTVAFPNPFTPEPVASLLLHFDGSDGSTTFTDSSVNELTFTVNGNASISTTQSKFGGASGYFDGVGGTMVSAPGSSNFAFDGDFTIEAWIYRTGDGTNCGGTYFAPIASGSSMSDASGWILFITNGTDINFLGTQYGGWSTIVYGSATMPTNEWVHVVASRSGPDVKIFVNGNLVASGTSSDSIVSGDNLYIGSYPVINGYAEASFEGYIDELRIVKGTAIYTADFTPPSAPFTPGGFLPNSVKGNDLWLDSDSPLVLGTNDVLSWGDLSGGNNPAVHSDYSPSPIVAESATPTGLRAIQFNGEPNVLAVNHSFNLKNSSGFVVVRQTSQSNGSGYPRILSFSPATGVDSESNDGMCLVINQNNGSAIELFSNSFNCSANVSLPLGWSVIGYTIDSSGFVRLRKDGDEVASFQNSDMAAASPAEMLIGFGGYFMSYESLQGEIAAVVHYDHKLGYAATRAVEKYLNNKFLETGTVQASLLLHFDGSNGSTNFADSSPNSLSVTASGNAVISTAQSKFGGSSVYFDPYYQSYLTVPSSDVFNFGTGDFTLECWVYLNSIGGIGGNNSCLFSRNGNDDWAAAFGWELTQGDETYFICGGDTIATGQAVSTGEWVHVAATRQNGNVNVYFNGTVVASGSAPGTINNSYDLTIGNRNISGQGGWVRQLDGYIDELRIVKGVALYTANFTPPTLPFGAEVSLLIHFDGANGSTTFTDSSPNALAVTANGNAVISTTQSKFGGASGYFDGSADLAFVPSEETEFGVGDFTIEFWLYAISSPQNNQIVVSLCLWPNTSGICIHYTNDNIAAFTGGFAAYHAVPRGADNAWHHYAVVRSNGQIAIYVDGVLGTPTPSSNGTFDQAFTDGIQYIGRPTDVDSYKLHGYIDELRIVKGAAIYTGNFTPPTAQFGN